MAVTTLTGGLGESLFKDIVDANFTSLVTSDAGNYGILSASSIESVEGKALTEFRAVCNANFAYIATLYQFSYTEMHDGDSWAECRDILNTNFSAAESAIVDASASGSPSEGTPSNTPSGSPSEGTPSGSPSEGTPSEGTPSSSPSA